MRPLEDGEDVFFLLSWPSLRGWTPPSGPLRTVRTCGLAAAAPWLTEEQLLAGGFIASQAAGGAAVLGAEESVGRQAAAT